jgi:hypothetical protein
MGHVAFMRERIGAFWWGNLRKSDNVEDLDFDGRVVL